MRRQAALALVDAIVARERKRHSGRDLAVRLMDLAAALGDGSTWAVHLAGRRVGRLTPRGGALVAERLCEEARRIAGA